MIREYKIVYFGLDTVPPEVIEEDQIRGTIIRRCGDAEQLGKEGWELVTFTAHTTATNITKYHAVLKRPKAE